MSMPKGSLQRAPWCCVSRRCGLLVKHHGAGVLVACVAGRICMIGQEWTTEAEGGANMLRHLEARMATEVCANPGVATRAAVAAMPGCAKHVYPARQARSLKMRTCELSATIVQSSRTRTLQM